MIQKYCSILFYRGKDLKSIQEGYPVGITQLEIGETIIKEKAVFRSQCLGDQSAKFGIDEAIVEG
jgi:hypothetical protein